MSDRVESDGVTEQVLQLGPFSQSLLIPHTVTSVLITALDIPPAGRRISRSPIDGAFAERSGVLPGRVGKPARMILFEDRFSRFEPCWASGCCGLPRNGHTFYRMAFGHVFGLTFRDPLPGGVTVAQEILVLFVLVRIQAG